MTAHEIGHNFGTGHTHCYAGIGGNANDIDQCHGSQQGCYAGPTSLPSGCPGGAMGCGTIMSYCHLRSGGIANISMTFGNGHPYGVAPERVEVVMESHISSVAAVNAACLAPVDQAFADGFESGDTTGWTSAVP